MTEGPYCLLNNKQADEALEAVTKMLMALETLAHLQERDVVCPICKLAVPDHSRHCGLIVLQKLLSKANRKDQVEVW